METDAMEDDVPDQPVRQRGFSEAELELARIVYDKARHFISVPASMLDQVYRNGFVNKKTIDGSRSIRMHGSRNDYRE